MEKAQNQFPFGGTVRWIGLRPGRDEPVRPVERVEVDLDEGLVGDRFQGPRDAPRQVTLIQREHLDVVAALLQRDRLDPSLTRRNIVVSGINLVALKGKVIEIGSAQLCITGDCAPCSRMERNLGKGGYNAMRGHGGVTASVVQGGTISIGDSVMFFGEMESASKRG